MITIRAYKSIEWQYWWYKKSRNASKVLGNRILISSANSNSTSATLQLHFWFIFGGANRLPVLVIFRGNIIIFVVKEEKGARTQFLPLCKCRRFGRNTGRDLFPAGASRNIVAVAYSFCCCCGVYLYNSWSKCPGRLSPSVSFQPSIHQGLWPKCTYHGQKYRFAIINRVSWIILQ